MCGLVGIYNKSGECARKSADTALHILRKLEYRGYDSAGMSIFTVKGVQTAQVVGRVDMLAMQIDGLNRAYMDSNARCVLAHNRWATTGKVCEENCHPHHSMNKEIHLVHNGIIENALELKSELVKNGYKFYGDTDSEILANYIEYRLFSLPKDTVQQVFSDIETILTEVEGTYGLAIVYTFHGRYSDSTVMFGFHRGSPLVLGENSDSYFLCSDLNSLSGISDRGLVLDPGCNVMLSSTGVSYLGADSKLKYQEISDREEYTHNGFKDYTMKEIHQQELTLKQTLAGRVHDGNVVISALDENARFLKGVTRIVIVAEGTSYHAGLVGKSFIESLSDVKVEVELASDYYYNIRSYSDQDLIIFISQSGETADVVKCLRECKSKFVKTMAITNGVDSQLSRMVDFGIYLRCGVEVGVASTKAFTSTILVLWLFACKLGRFNRLSPSALADPDSWIPSYLKIAEIDKFISDVVNAYDVSKVRSFVFLGKCEYKAIAMEAALKMNELSYIPSLAYSVGSLKHGPLGLVSDDIIFIVIDNDKKYSSDCQLCIDQLKSRNAHVWTFGYKEGNQLLRMFSVTILLQLLAYHVAEKLGNDIDKPRNLAKSVTVN